MRHALFPALALLALATAARAGLGLTPSEAEAAYGPNRLTAPKDADFQRLEISTNMVAISEHTLSNQVQVAIGYLHDDEGDLRGVVARYMFKDVPVPPPAWQATLLKQNAAGEEWRRSQCVMEDCTYAFHGRGFEEVIAWESDEP